MLGARQEGDTSRTRVEKPASSAFLRGDASMEHGRGDTPSPHQSPLARAAANMSVARPESGAVSPSVVDPLWSPPIEPEVAAGPGSHPDVATTPAQERSRQTTPRPPSDGRPGRATRKGRRPAGGCGCDKGCRIRRWRGKSRGNPLPTTLCPGHFRISHLFPSAAFSSSTCNTPPLLSPHHVRVPPRCSSRPTHRCLALQSPFYTHLPSRQSQ